MILQLRGKRRSSSKWLWDNVFSFWLSQVMVKLGSKHFIFCWCLDWQVAHIAFTPNHLYSIQKNLQSVHDLFFPCFSMKHWKDRPDCRNNICLPLTGSWGKALIWRIRAVHVGNCAAISCLHEDGHLSIFLLHASPVLVCMTEIWRVRVGLWEA